MRYYHSACADCHNGKGGKHRGIKAEYAQERCNNACGCCKGNGGRTLSRFKNCRKKEREENTDSFQNACVGGNVLYHTGNSNNLAEYAAGSGYKQNRAGNF